MKIKILCATAIATVIRQAVAAESELQFNPAFQRRARQQRRSRPVNAGARCRRASTILTCISTPSSRSQVTSRFAWLKTPPVKPCRALRLRNSPHLASTAVRLKGVSCRLRSAAFLTRSFADTRFDFDQRTLTLNFTVPQSAMRALPRGYVSPESWESGIPAAWLNYVVNGANNEYRGETRTREQQLFVSLNSGANTGAWRLRDFTTWTKEVTSSPTSRHGYSGISAPCVPRFMPVKRSPPHRCLTPLACVGLP